MIVWVMNCGDTGCDEDGYIACAQVFATKEKAVDTMRRCVAEDEECFETEAKWGDECFAVLERPDGRRIVYTVDETEVKE